VREVTVGIRLEGGDSVEALGMADGRGGMEIVVFVHTAGRYILQVGTYIRRNIRGILGKYKASVIVEAINVPI
jgi:hypothetical protein